MLGNYYKNKKILITGHTGFKGIWLTNILNFLGAKVYGISLDDLNKKNFNKLTYGKNINSYYFNILNKTKLNNLFRKIEPDIIFHLAAQSLVKKSYKFAVKTFETNFNGTLNVLSVSEKLKNLKSLIIVTSDKCYKNINDNKSFVETDPLGGDDPYSASKAAAEILFNSYLKNFLIKKKMGAASVRAGNVLGGGDWSEDRIIPDCAKKIIQSKKIIIRNPNSTRPWQHVLDVLNGYLILAMMLDKNPKYSGNWNFGPKNKSNISVKKLVKYFLKYMKSKNNIHYLVRGNKYKEKINLNLNSSKSNKILKWKNKYNTDQTLKLTASWYHDFMINGYNKEIIIKQINNFYSIK